VRRGDVIVVAAAGEFGKPRPAVVIQANLSMVNETITFLPITSDLERVPLYRIPIEPTQENGLRRSSEIMADRIQTSTLSRIGGIVGHIDRKTMRRVESALMVHLGLV